MWALVGDFVGAWCDKKVPECRCCGSNGHWRQCQHSTINCHKMWNSEARRRLLCSRGTRIQQKNSSSSRCTCESMIITGKIQKLSDWNFFISCWPSVAFVVCQHERRRRRRAIPYGRQPWVWSFIDFNFFSFSIWGWSVFTPLSLILPPTVYSQSTHYSWVN